MKNNLTIVVILVFTSYVHPENVEEFTNYVKGVFDCIKSYKLPVDNNKLLTTCDAKIHEYGTFDFVIVGAGSAGALLANRLSAVPNWKILLLEAGGNLTRFSDVPAFNDHLQQTDMNWGYLTSPQSTCCQGMENHQCIYPRGKVIGGSSTLNGGVYARGNPSDYNEWVELGNKGWSYNDVLPYFKKTEHVDLKSYDKSYHGSNGELYVHQTNPPSLVANAFLHANLENGLNEVDYNGKSQLGVSRIQFNIKDNIHENSAHAFLDPINERKNLKIALDALVTKVLVNYDKAQGVLFIKDGKMYKVKATKEVILSAGAINTPQILILSGIGPENDLKKLRIPIKANLPAVGKHLQDHPLFVNMYFRTNVSTPNLSLQENLERYFKGMTPLTNGAGLEQLAFINFNKSSTDPEIELLTFPPPFSVPENRKSAFNFKEQFGNVYEKYNPTTDISVIMSLLKPKSKGSVYLKSNSILDFPEIDINYFSDPNNQDLDTMYNGIKYILSLADTNAFKSINATYISEQPGCEDLMNNDREYWYCALRHMTSTEYHPSSTTRMGPTAHDSVVDSNGLVHTFKNLRVVDASIIPKITRGHLNAAVYMVAEKISDAIKKRYNE